jgi:hypothetical protein
MLLLPPLDPPELPLPLLLPLPPPVVALPPLLPLPEAAPPLDPPLPPDLLLVPTLEVWLLPPPELLGPLSAGAMGVAPELLLSGPPNPNPPLPGEALHP